MQGLIKTLNLGQAGLKINKSVARATTATSPCWGPAGPLGLTSALWPATRRTSEQTPIAGTAVGRAAGVAQTPRRLRESSKRAPAADAPRKAAGEARAAGRLPRTSKVLVAGCYRPDFREPFVLSDADLSALFRRIDSERAVVVRDARIVVLHDRAGWCAGSGVLGRSGAGGSSMLGSPSGVPGPPPLLSASTGMPGCITTGGECNIGTRTAARPSPRPLAVAAVSTAATPAATPRTGNAGPTPAPDQGRYVESTRPSSAPADTRPQATPPHPHPHRQHASATRSRRGA